MGGLFDEGDAWYLGKCVVKDADGNKKGMVKFHQELTDSGELEPTSVSARVRGAGADRVSIGIYETDPNDLTADDQMANLGEFRPMRGTLSACSACTRTMSPSTDPTASRVSSSASAASTPAPLSAPAHLKSSRRVTSPRTTKRMRRTTVMTASE